MKLLALLEFEAPTLLKEATAALIRSRLTHYDTTILGAGKDRLARVYVTLATRTKASSIDLSTLTGSMDGV